MKHGSLFTGIGGFDLAARWMGWKTVAQVEWDKWCQKVLAKNFPDTLRFGDIVEFNKMLQNGKIDCNSEGDRWKVDKNAEQILEDSKKQIREYGESFKEGSEVGCEFGGHGYNRSGINFRDSIGHIDILTGGFPCQPFSHAGKRKGTDDSRYLWPEMLTTIRILKPSFVVGENVAGLVSMENGKTLDRILSDLENEGYTTEQIIIPACAVGAWHRRDRIWIVAYDERKPDKCIPNNRFDITINGKQREKAGFINGGSNSTNVPDTQSKGLEGQNNPRSEEERGPNLRGNITGQNIKINPDTISQRGCSGDTGREYAENVRQQPGGEEHGYWNSEPSVGGGFNGLPLWLHRHTIKGYGQTESYRRIEILRELWEAIPTQVLWKVIGGFNQLQKSEILFAIVCEYEARPNETRVLLESQETLKEFVRGLWMRGEITGSSYRPDKGEQSTGEHTDTLQTLSRLLAHDLQENWQVSSWEDGIPRVSTGIKNRVDRLKGLGNAIVPQVAFQIFKAIEQYNEVLNN